MSILRSCILFNPRAIVTNQLDFIRDPQGSTVNAALGVVAVGGTILTGGVGLTALAGSTAAKAGVTAGAVAKWGLLTKALPTVVGIAGGSGTIAVLQNLLNSDKNAAQTAYYQAKIDELLARMNEGDSEASIALEDLKVEYQRLLNAQKAAEVENIATVQGYEARDALLQAALAEQKLQSGELSLQLQEMELKDKLNPTAEAGQSELDLAYREAQLAYLYAQTDLLAMQRQEVEDAVYGKAVIASNAKKQFVGSSGVGQLPSSYILVT